MAIPAAPTNVYVQQANATVLLSWDIVSGATSYTLNRSTDGVNFSLLGTSAVNSYLDSTVTVGTLYYYQVASVNASGTSSFTSTTSVTGSTLAIVPTNSADLSLGQLRLMAQQRADRVNSNFVTVPEWNLYINQAFFELYDVLTTNYEDYFVQSPYVFTTTGANQYTLPTDFYKLLGVDCGIANNNNAWATLKRFEFENRNEYVYPQITTTMLGIDDLRYKIFGNTIYFIPTPSAGQSIRLWYVPKATQLLKDTDIASGISGWLEYVIVDTAIRALQKEESDVSVLLMQKQALIKRIEEASMNRDAGAPACVTDSRRIQSYEGSPWNGSWGGN